MAIGDGGYADQGYGRLRLCLRPAPVCQWGYYSYYPYACAPYGFYGPSWFIGGLFIGAGPWYRGYWGRGYWGRGGYWHSGFYGRGLRLRTRLWIWTRLRLWTRRVGYGGGGVGLSL